jgi:lambda family phage portal protein
VILSGDTLYRLRTISEDKQKAHDLPIRVALQLVDSCRLADESQIRETIATGNTVWRGIEFNAEGERVAYWILRVPIYAGANVQGDAVRVTVAEMGHLYLEEDIDQPLGVPWFASAILKSRNTGDLEYNVLMQSAAAACVVATYSKPTGAARLGLNQTSGSDGSDLLDSDGNAINKLQPMMVINKGKDGAFDLQSPNQPNMNPEGFVQHLQRGIATAMPGTKASTVTGDYRNSSFSSERSADNDTWPEIADVQEWFAASFCQPIWETVLREAVMSDFFSGVVTAAEFQVSPGNYSAAKWQGPVALSINPKDDAAAASSRISGGLSSPQMECAKVNVNWRDVFNDIAELYSVAEEKGIPPEVVNNIMSVDAQDQIAAQIASDDTDDTPSGPNAPAQQTPEAVTDAA